MPVRAQYGLLTAQLTASDKLLLGAGAQCGLCVNHGLHGVSALHQRLGRVVIDAHGGSERVALTLVHSTERLSHVQHDGVHVAHFAVCIGNAYTERVEERQGRGVTHDDQLLDRLVQPLHGVLHRSSIATQSGGGIAH